MQNKEMLSERFGRWMQSGKGVKWALVLGICGVLLILLSEWLPARKTTAETPAAKTAEAPAAYM